MIRMRLSTDDLQRLRVADAHPTRRRSCAPRTRGLARQPRPITTAASARRSSANAGSSTCERPHARHRVRRERITTGAPATPRSTRRRAHAHRSSTPPQSGHAIPPAVSRRSTAAASASVYRDHKRLQAPTALPATRPESFAQEGQPITGPPPRSLTGLDPPPAGDHALAPRRRHPGSHRPRTLAHGPPDSSDDQPLPPTRRSAPGTPTNLTEQTSRQDLWL